MKFDDSDEDYFLHDFSSGTAGPEKAQPAGETPAPPSSAQAPRFEFSDSGATDSRQAAQGGDRTPRKRKSHFWTWFFTIVVVLLAGVVAVRYYVPYVTESRVTGYVTLVEKRGILFPTFEGEMVSESLLVDTSRIYSRDIVFSIPDPDLALRLQQYQGTGRPVTLTCKKYYGVLPWRGASTTVVVDFTSNQQ